VEYAGVPDGGSVTVLGLGPIGDMATRIAKHKGLRVIGVDLVDERLDRARANGIEVLDLREHEDSLAEVIRDMTDGRGTDSVIDAVGMEAHGSPGAKLAQTVVGLLPDGVAERLAMAERHGITTLDASVIDDVPAAVSDMTDGRGTDSVIDAVGMEAHGSTVAAMAHKAVGLMPDALGRRMMEKAGLDKLSVLHAAIATVRRGGTISLSGVYGGMADPIPMMELFDKQVQLRMGQANVRRWVDEILPLVGGDDDPLGVEDLATHRVSLGEAPQAYADFQQKRNGTIKVLLEP